MVLRALTKKAIITEVGRDGIRVAKAGSANGFTAHSRHMSHIPWNRPFTM
jgi:hypothetical protein